MSQEMNEASRLSALRSLQLLDTPPDREFDGLVELAAEVCGTPMSTITLVDDHRQWFKAAVGTQVCETPRDFSFCSHAIEQSELFTVEDATKDPRFCDNPLVVGKPYIRFYAGMQLEEPGGHRIGTLCVMDVVPRTLTASQQQSLMNLAWQAQAWIQQRYHDLQQVRSSLVQAKAVAASEAKRRRIVESSLDKVNELLSSILESTIYSVIEVDPGWVIRYRNSKASPMATETVLHCDFWEVFSDLLGTVAEEQLRYCMSERKPTNYEVLLSMTGRWYKVSATPTRDGISIFSVDMTHEKEMAAALERERMLREKRIEALSHMAGGLAHEISNPLAIIHALVSDLRDASASGAVISPEELQSVCEETLQTAERAGRILRGLRAFARDGAKEPMEDVSLASIAGQAVELQHQRFERSLIRLTLSELSDMQLVRCRPIQILQVITNLLNNAFDVIDATNPKTRDVRVTVGKDELSCYATVEDSGPGIAKESRDQLMTLFFTTKAVGGGMGIGLSLSKAIAEDHNGNLTLEESLPTCFRLSLPLLVSITEASGRSDVHAH